MNKKQVGEPFNPLDRPWKQLDPARSLDDEIRNCGSIRLLTKSDRYRLVWLLYRKAVGDDNSKGVDK